MNYSKYYGKNIGTFMVYKEQMSDDIYLNCPLDLQVLLKEYGRARTRELFDKVNKGYRFTVKPEKAAALIDLMQGLNDWEYDGTVDTGHLGGGRCTLGHALRYEHYARSESTGKELIFGSTCVGDFFGIQQDVIRKIDDVRKSATEEIMFALYVYENDKEEEYRNEVYSDIPAMCSTAEANDKLVSMLGVYKDVAYKLMSYQYPLPKKIVEIIERFRQWYSSDYTVQLKREALRNKLEGISTAFLKHYDKICSGDALDIALNKMLRSTGSFDFSTEIIACSVITSKNIEDSRDVVQRFDEITDARVFYTKNKQYTVSNGKMKRLATEEEVTEKCLGVTEEGTLLIAEDETNRALASLKYCCKMSPELATVIDNKEKEYLVRVCDQQKAIFKAISFLNKRFEEYESRINSVDNTVKYGKADINIPEIQPEYPFEYVFRYVKDNMKGDASPIVRNIMSRYNFHSKLSLKQGQIIRIYFNNLIGDSDNADNSDNRIVSKYVSEYTSKNDIGNKVVYTTTREKDAYAICVLDSDNKIIHTGLCNTNSTEDIRIGVEDVHLAFTYIEDRSDSENLSKIFGFGRLKTSSFGKELSIQALGNGSRWIKFAEIGKFVGLENRDYDQIIESTGTHRSSEKGKYSLMRTAVMLAIAYSKIQ